MTAESQTAPDNLLVHPAVGEEQQRTKPVARKARRRPVRNGSDLQKDVIVRLQRLRSTTKDISRSYLANMEHRILELMDEVNSSGKKGGIKTRTLRRISDVLDELKLKPEKGRRKDLKKIDEALDELSREISEEDD